MRHLTYRADVDGLRALAVTGVIAFHAFPSTLPGGFVGVDLFFVISGYLITKIIVDSLQSENFSFVEFYVRRVRRIFPALCLVLFASLALGWLILLPDEFKQFSKHLAAAATFLSNFALLREAGYFDAAADTKPLLHLWSLGIEEQFYIFWPLLLWSMWKARQKLLLVVSVLAVASLIASIALTTYRPNAAFYLPVSRFWELGMGGILAITAGKLSVPARISLPLSIAGLTAILVAFLCITPQVQFPGWIALLPTAGGAALIAAGPKGWLNRQLLCSRPWVYLGKISYPVYLWHWVLLSFASISAIGHLGPMTRVVLVAASLILGSATFHLLEQPIRRAGMSVKPLVVAMLVILAGSALVYVKDGFKGSSPPDQLAILNYYENSLPDWKFYEREGVLKAYRDDCNFYDVDAYRLGKASRRLNKTISSSCYTPSGSGHTVFVWGDSHAQQLLPGLSKALPPGWQLLQVASSGCRPALILQPSGDYCEYSNWFALERIRQYRPSVVILAQDSGHSVEIFRKIANQLHDDGIERVIVVGPVPHWQPYLYKIAARRGVDGFPRRLSDGLDSTALAANTAVLKQLGRDDPFMYVDAMSALCNEAGCLSYVGDDVVRGLTTFDYGHLSFAASEWLARTVLVPKLKAELSYSQGGGDDPSPRPHAAAGRADR